MGKELTEKQFNEMSAKQQFKWIFENKDKVKLILDNDSTSVELKGNDDWHCYLTDWLGNSPGIDTLLNALGIESEYC